MMFGRFCLFVVVLMTHDGLRLKFQFEGKKLPAEIDGCNIMKCSLCQVPWLCYRWVI